MIEIKIYHLDELINFNINDEDSTHICLIKEGEDTLGFAGIKLDQDDVQLIFTEMRIEDKFLFDGLIKTIVNYAFTKGCIELVVFDEDAISYLKNMNVSITDNTINIEEFHNKTHCRKI